VRQLTYVRPGLAEWRDAIVRPLAVARCDLDVAMATLGLFPGPYPVGHETVAEIVATGAEASRWQPGDRVLVPFQVSCGRSPACLAGRFAACHPYRARAGAAVGFGAGRPAAGTAAPSPTAPSVS